MPFNRLIFRTGLLAWLNVAALFSAPAWSLPDDNKQPINIESNSAKQTVIENGEKTEYFGDVVLTQGSMLLKADTVVIFSADRVVTKMIAYGKPAHFQQQSDPDKTPVMAYGNRIEYKLDTETIVLHNDASIIQNGTTVSGKRIDYNINTEQVKANSNNNGRVKMVLEPSDKTATAPADNTPVNKDNNGDTTSQ